MTLKKWRKSRRLDDAMQFVETVKGSDECFDHTHTECAQYVAIAVQYVLSHHWSNELLQ